MHICALDERGWFERAMALEAQAASHPVRRAALALAEEDAWLAAFDDFREQNKATFAVAGAPPPPPPRPPPLLVVGAPC